MGICKGEIREEVKKQLWLGVPLIFVNVLNSSLPMISLMFIGHLDDRVLLAGAALANSFMMAIGTAVLVCHIFFYIIVIYISFSFFM